MNITELKDFLTKEGFTFAKNGLKDQSNQCDWYAYRKTKLLVRNCTCNTDKGMTLVVYPYKFDFDGVRSESVQLELIGEYINWYRLTCYSLTPDVVHSSINAIEARLVNAWNALST